MRFYSKINFIVPTYKRSNTKLPVFIDSFVNKAARPGDVYFTLVVNTDDVDTVDYLRDHYHHNIKIVLVPQSDKPHLAQLMNAGFDQSQFKGEEWVYGYIGDDFACDTKWWDAIVLDTANRSHGMKCIWGYDGYLNDLPTYYFMPDRLFRAMDTPHWVYPHAGMELTDLITRDILSPLGLMWHCPHLLFEHRHSTRPGFGGADATFLRLQEADNSKATAVDVREYILTRQARIKDYMLSIRKKT